MPNLKQSFSGLLGGMEAGQSAPAPSAQGALGFDLSKLAQSANTPTPEAQINQVDGMNLQEDTSLYPSDEELMGQANKLDEKKQGLDKQNSDIDSKVQDFKDELLKNLIYTLESLGVDTSSIYSIQQFLDELEQKNPDMRLYVESILGLLTGETPQVETNDNPQGDVVNAGSPILNTDQQGSVQLPDMSGATVGNPNLPQDTGSMMGAEQSQTISTPPLQ